MNFKYYLTPVKKRKTINAKFKIWTIDFETNPVTNEFKLVCLCHITKDTHNKGKMKYTTYTFFSLKELFLFIKKEEITYLFVFNIKFDMCFLLSYIVRKNYQFHIIESNQNVLGLTFQFSKKKETDEDMKVVIKDFFPFARTSLDKISKSLKCENKKYPEKVDTNWFKTCSMEELKHHCEQDTKVLAECITIFRNLIFDKFRIDFLDKKIYSLASLAMKIYRSNFITGKTDIENSFFKTHYDPFSKEYSIELNRELYDFIHESYMGGYTDVFNTSKLKNVVSFDINSSYPFQATILKFPTGKGYYTTDFEEFSEKTKNIEGFCKLTVDFIGSDYYIPVKKDGEFKRQFGEWEGIITTIEMKYLIEKQIHFIFEGGYYFLEFDKSESLSNYCKTLYKLKKDELDESPLRDIYKILLNGLTGKFGQRIDSTNNVFKVIKTKDIWKIDTEYNSLEIDGDLTLIQTKEETETYKNFMMVSWISLITACGRIQLLRKITETKAFYCDTDSVYCFEKDGQISNKELGGWKIEHKISEFRALAPKCYAFKDSDNNNTIKLKGVPKEYRTEKVFNKIMNYKNGDGILIEDIHKFLSYKECIHRKSPKYKSDLFVGADISKKQLFPIAKYSKEELELWE